MATPKKPEKGGPKSEKKAPKAEATAPAAPPAATPKAKAAPAAAAAPVPHTPPTPKRQGFRRSLIGHVTSNKMNKTVTVEVTRNALDPVYKKYVRMRARYKAHDETNQYKVGDRVEITEHRPISRDKRWLVTKLIARPVQE